MQPYHIAIFAKRPLPGRVKTRLAQALGAGAAADLYTAMLWDTVTAATSAGAESGLIVHDGAEPRSWLPALPTDWRLLPQSAGDLGQRLQNASAAAVDRHPLLFLGSDSPDLPAQRIRDAGAALATHDLVLGPCPDGGVWCIGLRRPAAGLFLGIPWSRPETGSALRNRATELGLKWADVAGWQDVDQPGDLAELATRLAADPGAAVATRRWLAEHAGPWARAPIPSAVE